MAEGSAHKLTMAADEPKDEHIIYGSINVTEAKEYTDGLEKIMDNLGDLLWEGNDDALDVTIKEVKNYMIKTWPDMAGADVGTVMSFI